MCKIKRCWHPLHGSNAYFSANILISSLLFQLFFNIAASCFWLSFPPFFLSLPHTQICFDNMNNSNHNNYYQIFPICHSISFTKITELDLSVLPTGCFMKISLQSSEQNLVSFLSHSYLILISPHSYSFRCCFCTAAFWFWLPSPTCPLLQASQHPRLWISIEWDFSLIHGGISSP